jgi:hypothetical protein
MTARASGVGGAVAATAADAGAGAGMERDEEEKTGPGDDEEEGGGGCWRRSEVRSEKREGKSRCGCDWERAAMATESDSLELGGGMVTSTFTFTFTFIGTCTCTSTRSGGDSAANESRGRCHDIAGLEIVRSTQTAQEDLRFLVIAQGETDNAVVGVVAPGLKNDLAGELLTGDGHQDGSGMQGTDLNRFFRHGFSPRLGIKAPRRGLLSSPCNGLSVVDPVPVDAGRRCG